MEDIDNKITTTISEILETEVIRKGTAKAAANHKEWEKKKRKEGWRFVEVTRGLKILVPCDRKGKPTAEGQERLNRKRETFFRYL